MAEYSDSASMPTIKHKVFAYITHADRLLVFSHPDSPDAGIQVPAGTVDEGEDPENAVMREAFEETGLTGLQLHAYLGEDDYHVPELDQTDRRRFYHLTCGRQPPTTWRHEERHPSDGSPGPYTFEFFWVRLPDKVPPLAPGHDAMLPKLLELLQRQP